MRLVYYADCVTGDVVKCEAAPVGYDRRKLAEALRDFNSRENRDCDGYVIEVEDGSLYAHLFREATRQHTYPRDAIDAALEVLDMARAEIESLRSVEK